MLVLSENEWERGEAAACDEIVCMISFDLVKLYQKKHIISEETHNTVSCVSCVHRKASGDTATEQEIIIVLLLVPGLLQPQKYIVGSNTRLVEETALICNRIEHLHFKGQFYVGQLNHTL